MNELRAKLDGNAGIRNSSRQNAAPDAGARFENEDFPSAVFQFTRSHQARSACTDDDYISGWHIHRGLLQLSFRMADRHLGRVVARILAGLLLIVTGCLGGYNAISEWNDPATLLQRSVMVGSAAYFLAGVIGGVGVLLRRRWGLVLAAVWGAVVTYTGTMAVFAYDPGATPASVLGAFAICVLISAVVIWLAKIGTKTILNDS